MKQALADTAGGTKCTGTPVNWVREDGVVGFDPGFSPDGKTVLGSGKVWGFRPTAEEDVDFFAVVFPASATAADAARVRSKVRGRVHDAAPLFNVQGNIKAMLKGLAKFELTGKNGTYVYAVRVVSKTSPARSETVVSQPFTVGTGAAAPAKAGPPTCKRGTADVDRNPQNGCEVDLLTNPWNCGAVGKAVPAAPFALTSCRKGIAVIRACRKNHFDLDKAFRNGCESTVAPKKKR